MFLATADTKVALVASAPTMYLANSYLTNEMMAARAKVNTAAGSKRLLSMPFLPRPARMARRSGPAPSPLKPKLVKGFAVGDSNPHKELADPWHGQQEAGALRLREDAEGRHRDSSCTKASFSTFAGQSVSRAFALMPTLPRRRESRPRIGQQLIIIYHSGYRNVEAVGSWTPRYLGNGDKADGMNEVTDLAEIAEKYGVTNVYGDLGQLFSLQAPSSAKNGSLPGGLSHKGSGHRSRRVGHRCSVDRFTAVANRRTKAAGNTGRYTEAIRIQPLGPADGEVRRPFPAEIPRAYTITKAPAGWSRMDGYFKP